MTGMITARRHGAPAFVAGALLVALGLALAAVLAGCGGGEAEGPPVVYTEAESGTTVKAAVGDSIIIRLVENPSTGYTWQVDLSAGLEEQANAYIEPSVAPGVVGAAGTREVSVVVKTAGSQSVEAVYVRPWEDESEPPEQTFVLTIQAE
jgi:predicted secreted protein